MRYTFPLACTLLCLVVVTTVAAYKPGFDFTFPALMGWFCAFVLAVGLVVEANTK